MKNSMRLGLLACCSLALVGCGTNGASSSTVNFFELQESDIGTATKAKATSLSAYTESNPLKIAMVTDSGTLNDHSFNESAWKGVNAFAEENGTGKVDTTTSSVNSGNIQTKYYQPSAGNYDTAGRLAAMTEAVSWGAKVIALPGYLFESAIARALESDTFKDVYLLALDCNKQDDDNGYKAYEYTKKVTSIIYREEQSGFLAGYAAVKDGYRKLGFCGGMAVPAVVRYGSGYCQGADAAAQELGLADGAIDINYYYAGAFAATDKATSYCNGWYNRGTEIIFACGGAVYQSVTNASQSNGNKPWIGVDVNQHADTSLGASQASCITSAMKNLTNAIQVLLASWCDNSGNWSDLLAGNVVTVGAKSLNCVLPTPDTTGDADCWGFKNFTVNEYQTELSKLQDGTVKVNSNSDNEVLSANNFGCSAKVKVNYIKD